MLGQCKQKPTLQIQTTTTDFSIFKKAYLSHCFCITIQKEMASRFSSAHKIQTKIIFIKSQTISERKEKASSIKDSLVLFGNHNSTKTESATRDNFL